MNAYETCSLGPGAYKDINFEVGMKGFTSKKMLGRTAPIDRRIDPNEPGPGTYEIPTSFDSTKRDKPPEPHIKEKRQRNIYPGPGEYDLLDGFELKSQVTSPQRTHAGTKFTNAAGVDEHVARMEKSREEGKNLVRKGFAHFGSSTRNGTVLTSFDSADGGIRTTHVPPIYKDASHKERLDANKYKGPPGPGTYY